MRRHIRSAVWVFISVGFLSAVTPTRSQDHAPDKVPPVAPNQLPASQLPASQLPPDKFPPATASPDRFPLVPARPALPGPTAPTRPGPNDLVTVYRLQNSQAESVALVLQQLFGGRDSSVVAVAGSNAIVFRGPRGDEVSQMVRRLDNPQSREHPLVAPPAEVGPAGSAVAPELRSPLDVAPVPPGELDALANNLVSLQAIYREVQRETVRIAERAIRLELDAETSLEERVALRRDLREYVAAGFSLQQQVQQAELAVLQLRIRILQRNLAAREQIRDSIIDRRVEELLYPDLQWQPEGWSPPAPPSVATPPSPANSPAEQVTDESAKDR